MGITGGLAPDDDGESIVGLTMVIGEDSNDIADLLELTLTKAGMQVVGIATSGQECIALAEALQPDMMILDLHMPEMGGLEALPRIGEVSPRTRVVVHSAIGATFMTESTLAAGVYAYIQKGVTPRTIVRHLERVAAAGSVRPVRPFPLNREYAS